MAKKLLRVAAFVLALVMCFSMTACKNASSDEYSSVTFEDSGLVIDDANNQNEENGGTTSGGGSGNAVNNNSGTASGTTSGGNTSQGTNNGGTTGNNTATGNSGGNKGNQNTTSTEDIGGKVEIGKGETAMDKGLDFGGKKFTLAVDENANYNSTSYNAMISAFEKKYNCKIEKKYLDFGSWNSQVSQQMSTGKSYDIIYFHGSKFPEFAINNLAEDLTKYITTADLVGSDPTKGGIDLVKSQNFSWNGKLYALCDYKSQNPDIFYYNKALFKQYGLEDPRELYEQGKWTWDKIFEMGAQVTDRDAEQYFLGGNFSVTQLFGVSCLSIENGKVVERFSNATYYKALQLYQKVYVGNTAIGEPLVNDTVTNTAFIEGRSFTFFEESSKWEGLAPEVAKSFAFNKDINNLGIVPCPLPKENTQKLYPVGWYTGIAAGKGSDPRAAVAFAKFASSFQSPVKDKYPMRDEDRELIKKLQAGKTLSNRHGAYSATNVHTTTIYNKILIDIRKGDDIATVISKYKPQIISCIKATVGEGNYVSK